MKRILAVFIFTFSISGLVFPVLASTADNLEHPAQESHSSEHQEEDSQSHDHAPSHDDSSDGEHHGEDGEHHSEMPPVGWVIPFVVLLGMIATGPLFYEHFWHKHYPKVAIALAAIVVLYYIFGLGNVHAPVHAFFEYVPFISLLAALFIASGGVAINIDRKSRPLTNIILLAIGAVIANLIGTTGASMLLIRPYIRLNRGRIKAYHIIFFIFIVSNVGGSLTPIGDPPLFLGFLKGVPFFWTLTHNLIPWALAILMLLGIFFVMDSRNNKEVWIYEDEPTGYSGKITIKGSKNFLWLLVVIVFVFIDPNVFDWVPYIMYDGAKFSFIKEIVWLTVAFCSYRFASKEAISMNDFSFEPIREVAFIFVGIFGTMMPALELVGDFAKSESGAALITHNTLYWGTGMLSGFLDNAPTYLNFLAAALASQGGDIGNISQVSEFANGGVYHDSVLSLKAISVAAVFFGAMTYIGNGPNFMVKSISEQIGIKMPSFFGYILRFSIPILVPMLIIIWLIFFAFA
ncbi:MAG TPA: citrate transporter [Cytophagales bacterium]|nr:citrate transporter [Cytophagales bacterium]HAA23388.1 citrate transporter [Cytophagales bacterium]HAP58131.1 citrate transporter [Cytophagales bacterium]